MKKFKKIVKQRSPFHLIYPNIQKYLSQTIEIKNLSNLKGFQRYNELQFQASPYRFQ